MTAPLVGGPHWKSIMSGEFGGGRVYGVARQEGNERIEVLVIDP